MYDKVKLSLYNLPNDYNWHEVLNRITPVSYKADDSGGSGLWHNHRVVATDSFVIFEGSFPKCLYRNNIYSLRLKEVEGLIMQLSNDLGVSMYDAEVESVEFAHNFIMDNAPSQYTAKLRGCKGFTTNNWYDTLYAENSKIRLKFYDKIKEAKKKRELPKYKKDELPENLLRYEVTFKKDGLEDLFKRTLTAKELWDKEVFMNFVVEWLGYYDDLTKLTDDYLNVDFNTFESAKDFDRWCICAANSGQNLSYYIKEILFKHRVNRHDSDRKLHAKIQKRISDALEWGKTHLPTSALITELTDKMDSYVNWLIEQSEDGMSEKELEYFLKRLVKERYS